MLICHGSLRLKDTLSGEATPLKGKNLLLCGNFFPLTLLHSDRPKLHRVLAVLSATGLRVNPIFDGIHSLVKQTVSHKIVSLCKRGGRGVAPVVGVVAPVLGRPTYLE